MRYDLDIQPGPTLTPRVSVTQRNKARENTQLLGQMLLAGVTDVARIKEVNRIVSETLRAVNEI
jgi:hypothetical protein